MPVVLLPEQGKGAPTHTRGIIAPAPIQPSTPSNPHGSSPSPTSISVSPRTVPNGTAITIQSPSPVTRQSQSPRNAIALEDEGGDGAGVDLGNEEEEDDDDEEEGEVEEGAYLRSKLWWLGMLLISVGEGGNFLSYGFAPASVVAPLGTVVSGIRPGGQDRPCRFSASFSSGYSYSNSYFLMHWTTALTA